MAFVFCTGDTRGGPLRTQINNVMGMSRRRATGIASKPEMRRYLLAVQQWVDRNSRTAQKLLQKGHDCQEQIHLVGTCHGMYASNMTTSTATKGPSAKKLDSRCATYTETFRRFKSGVKKEPSNPSDNHLALKNVRGLKKWWRSAPSLEIFL